MRTIFLAAACLIATTSAAQSIEEPLLAEFMSNKRKAAEKRHADIEESIRLAERGRVNPRVRGEYVLQELRGDRKRYVFASPDSKDKIISQLKAQLADANNPIQLLPIFDEWKFPEGHVGRLPDDTCNIIQVVDDSNVIVRLYHARDRTAYVGNSKRGYSSVSRPPVITEHWLWLEMDTEGMADDHGLDVSDYLFRSLGTKTYTTAGGGSKTVPYLTTVDVPRTPDTPPPAAAHAFGR